VCKTRAVPPRPLARREARADVRVFSNLGLLLRIAMYESRYVEWDVDMVRSLRPSLASSRAAAPTVPLAQLWAASVLRPREPWRRR
jgi:hypothetical protein